MAKSKSRIEADKYGVSLEQAHNLLEKLVRLGKMTRRTGGKSVYYRRV